MRKIIIILGVLGVSFSAIFVRFATAPSMVLVFYRMFFASVVLVPIVLLKKQEELKSLKLKQWIQCIVSGVFLGFHFLAFFESLQHTSVASAVVLVDTEVFFVALAMILLFKQQLSKMAWFAIVITFIGSIIIALSDVSGFSNPIVGNILAFLGAVFMTVYTLLGSRVRQNVSTLVYTSIAYSVSAITILLLAMISNTPVLGYAPINITMGLLMALFCTLLGHSVFNWGLKYESASYISAVKLLEPVFATIISIFIFSEIPSIQIILGGLLVLFGIYMYSARA